jgi:hypothetical protein
VPRPIRIVIAAQAGIQYAQPIDSMTDVSGTLDPSLRGDDEPRGFVASAPLRKRVAFVAGNDG